MANKFEKIAIIIGLILIAYLPALYIKLLVWYNNILMKLINIDIIINKILNNTNI